MPSESQALFRRALAALQAGDGAQADALLVESLSLKPKHFDSLKLLGYLRACAGRPMDAVALLEKAVRIEPTDVNVLLNLGSALGETGRTQDAMIHLRRAAKLQPGNFGAWFGMAALAARLGRHGEAADLYARALEIDATVAAAWGHRGNALAALKRHAEALTDYDRAIATDPASAAAWSDKAATLMELGRHEDALNHFERALELDPDLPFVAGQALHLRMLCCDWDGLDARMEAISDGLAKGRRMADPFGFQAVSHSEAELKACAQIYAADTFPPVAQGAAPRKGPMRDRIRVGYLCGEFRAQATSVLMASLYELHDRERLELFAFDSGWDDASPLRRRIEKAFDHFVPIGGLDDDQAAGAIRSAGIDILVNLNGYFGQVRQGVFARRPAPIQVNYLGFPGTLGATYIDYLIADPIVIPASSRHHYVEKIVHLTGCYQPNDPAREIAETARSRESLGLPPIGFVYCCFNNNYKITPTMFHRWMRILRQVEGSVLWLLHDNPWAERNLRAEAARRGVDDARLVFARREALPDHLARQRAADLFLDTSPYNAHTTASDALWAGLPLLTLRGTTFPGRVAESLLHAAGLPELVAADGDAYERMAVELARAPDALGALRQRLAEGRHRAPLFDAIAHARRMDDAFSAMYERFKDGSPPDHLTA